MHGVYVKRFLEKTRSLTVIFSTKEKIGALAEVLKIFSVCFSHDQFFFFSNHIVINFQEHKVNLIHIESRPSKRFTHDYEFLIEIDPSCDNVKEALNVLREKTQYLQVISRQPSGEDVHWFPIRINEIDRFVNHILSYGAELDADHPVSYIKSY